MNLDLPELERIEAKLDRLLGNKAVADPISEWSSIKTAWKLKGGCAYETMRTQRRLQPKGGLYDAYVGGVGVFSRETIVEWLAVTDDQLEAYHRKHRTGCVIDKGRRSIKTGPLTPKAMSLDDSEAAR